MSYDVSIYATTKSDQSYAVGDSLNTTWNLAEMYTEAGCHPRDLNDKPTVEVAAILQKGITDMEARSDHFKQFNAENGWGVYEDALRFLKTLKDLCENYPGCTVSVS